MLSFGTPLQTDDRRLSASAPSCDWMRSIVLISVPFSCLGVPESIPQLGRVWPGRRAPPAPPAHGDRGGGGALDRREIGAQLPRGPRPAPALAGEALAQVEADRRAAAGAALGQAGGG